MNEALDVKEVWGRILSYVRKFVSEQTYNTWFVPITPIAVNGETIYLQVPNRFFYEWVDSHFREVLNRAMAEVLGRVLKLNFTIVLDEGSQEDVFPEQPVQIKSPLSDGTASSGYFENISRINEYYTFDNFVEGSSNQFAKAASI
ncbi:MAG: hypothetical protein DRP92_06645, partial [Candidatus Neomarinimicrobiota bacterium]